MLLLILAWMLNEEGWHGVVEHRKVDSHWHGSTSLSLVARSATVSRIDVHTPLFLEHANVSLGIIVWLRGWTETNWRDWCRDRHLLLLEWVVSGHE